MPHSTTSLTARPIGNGLLLPTRRRTTLRRYGRGHTNKWALARCRRAFSKGGTHAIRVFKRNINALLEKHKKVIVLFAAGNHDPASSAWLQESFAELYSDNPRVEIIVSPLPYYAHAHGVNMLSFHHGHKAKTTKVHHTIMGEFRELMGKTKQTFVHTGHLHDEYTIEFPGALIERHPTIASRDAYSSHGGWNSLRRMSVITYHEQYFETERHRFYPQCHPLT